MNRNVQFRSVRINRVTPIAIFSAVLLLTIDPAFAASRDPLQIMKNVYEQDTSHGTSMRATFESFDKQGHSKKKELLYRRLGKPGNSKTLVVFTGPEEIRGVKLLSINQRGAETQQYLFIPATKRVRSIAQQERSTRFIGTDFTIEDIGEPALDDFSYRLLGDSEIIEGHKTFKVEATPIDASRTQYKFIDYWVAQDAPVILQSELYDSQGRQTRVLHTSQIKRVSGIWGARRREMSTVADGTRTVLTIDQVKFNVKMDERLFTPESLDSTDDPGLR
jgi:outer membrane lipoprotein-sorting protein